MLRCKCGVQWAQFSGGWIPEVHFQKLTTRGQWGLGTHPRHPWNPGCSEKRLVCSAWEPGVVSAKRPVGKDHSIHSCIRRFSDKKQMVRSKR